MIPFDVGLGRCVRAALVASHNNSTRECFQIQYVRSTGTSMFMRVPCMVGAPTCLDSGTIIHSRSHITNRSVRGESRSLIASTTVFAGKNAWDSRMVPNGCRGVLDLVQATAGASKGRWPGPSLFRPLPLTGWIILQNRNPQKKRGCLKKFFRTRKPRLRRRRTQPGLRRNESGSMTDVEVSYEKIGKRDFDSRVG
jgi:hypothetical protein